MESVSREALRPVMSPIRRSFRRNNQAQDNTMSVDDDDELPRVQQTNSNSSSVDHLRLKLGEQYEFLDKWTYTRAGGSVGGFENLVHVDDGLWDLQGDEEEEEEEEGDDEIEVKSEEEEDVDIEVDELESDGEMEGEFDHDPIDSFEDVGRKNGGPSSAPVPGPSTSTSTLASPTRRIVLKAPPRPSISSAFPVIPTKSTTSGGG